MVDPREIPDWDKWLLDFRHATIFHTAGWCGVLCDTYRYRPLYLLDWKEDRLAAALPLIEVRSWFTGSRGISLPFTDECGPLLRSGEFSKPLLDRAVALGGERHWKYLELRELPASEPPETISLRFYSHELNLRESEAHLLSRFEGSVRRAIRKAEGSGLHLEISDSLDAMRDFYRLHCFTRKRHGLPPQPFAFFRNIWRHIIAPGHGSIVLASKDSAPIAGAVYFRSGTQAIYKFGASNDACQALRPNNLVMWSAIRHLRQKGCHTLAFGRTSLDNEGLRRFKLGWGCSERILGYWKYSFRTSSPVRDHDRAAGRHTAFFHRIPRPLSRLLGAALYRHIA